MSAVVPSPGELAAQLRPELDLLVWDAPNVDMTLANVIGRRPTASTRPRYDHVARWLVGSAGERPVQAVVFTNYAEGTAAMIRGWLEAVRGIGFDVFIKPKVDADDDIDDKMLEHIEGASRTSRLTRLVVVSGDGRNFQEPLEVLAAAGVVVTVVSFNEVASWARLSTVLNFVDLEDIPGAFREPLDRVRLESLPLAGAWMRATGDLRSTVARLVGGESVGELAAAS